MIRYKKTVAGALPLAQPFYRCSGHALRHAAQDERTTHWATMHNAPRRARGEEPEQQAAAKSSVGSAQRIDPMKAFQHPEPLARRVRRRIDLDQC